MIVTSSRFLALSLVLLLSAVAAASIGYPEQSWVVVRAADYSKSTSKAGQSLRVRVSANGPKQPREVAIIVFAAERRGTTISVVDTDSDTTKIASPGTADLHFESIDAKNPRFISIGAIGFLPAGVLVDSGGVEIEVILVPELPK